MQDLAMGQKMFEGLAGRATAKVMARMNLDSEREAIEILSPSPGDRVVALGIGAGVGVDLLAARLSGAAHSGDREGKVVQVVGVDPSAAMLAEASRRNRRWIDVGSVELVEATAALLDLENGAFDGAIAVNSIQLWEPLDVSLREVSRVLRSGARLVSLTHDWAIERSTGRDVDGWSERICMLSEAAGFTAPRVWRGRAEDGRSVAFAATRA
ncbi:MAG: methyltransferase domain-containing protein [Acidimicrobiales bacterium]